MAGYDPQQVISTWLFPIQGAMDGEFFNAEHQQNDVDLHIGAQGFGSYVENADKSGMISITLSQLSPTNVLLSAAFAAKRVGTFLMKDLTDTFTLVEGQEARIQKHAPIKRGQKIVGMEWKFLCKRLILTAGGDA